MKLGTNILLSIRNLEKHLVADCSKNENYVRDFKIDKYYFCVYLINVGKCIFSFVCFFCEMSENVLKVATHFKSVNQ